MSIRLRESDNDPYLYLEPISAGSVAIGTDASDSNKLKIVMSDAVTDVDPSSATPSISIDPTTNGNITFQPQGTGLSQFITGDVEISSGNLDMTNTAAAGLSGVIQFGGDRFIHNYGTGNTFIGDLSGTYSLTTADALENTAVGSGGVLGELTTGPYNTCIGANTGLGLTTGNSNTAVGLGALANCITGSNNIAIGSNAGINLAHAESYNIYIGSEGSFGESHTTRIGLDNSLTGQTSCYIAGIEGASVTPVGMVVISSTGQLGTSGAFPTTWNDVTSTPVTMVPNNGYVVDDNASLVTLTLPSVAAFGSRFEIVGKSADGWTIAQNAGQTIHFNSTSTTTGAGGSLSSTQRYNCVELICVTANTEFVVKDSSGNLTVV
jgi:hypothetical protein